MLQLPATTAIEYVAACCRTRTRTRTKTRTKTKTGTKTKSVRGLMPVPPKFNAYTNRLGFLCLASQRDGQTNRQKNRQTRPRSSAGSRPPLPKFSGYVEVEAHYIFHPSTIWVRLLFTELGPKTPPKADFAMKQTNICRLSGDIKISPILSVWQIFEVIVLI